MNRRGLFKMLGAVGITAVVGVSVEVEEPKQSGPLLTSIDLKPSTGRSTFGASTQPWSKRIGGLNADA